MHALSRSLIPLAALAAGCSAAASTPPVSYSATAALAASRAPSLSATAQSPSQGFVYACTLEPRCFVFTSAGKRVRTIQGDLQQPSALVSDPQGYVYVSDAIANQVAIYSPGMKRRIATRTGVDVGFDMAVHAGTIAVGGGNTITVLPAGGKPRYFLSDPDAMQGNGLAFDSHGNCYWSVTLNDGKGTDRVDEFDGCAGSPQHLAIPGSPLWLAFDGNDDLYYVDFAANKSSGIYRCAGLSHCSLAFGRGTEPRALRFNQGWGDLYVADLGGSNISRINIASGKVDEVITRGFQGYSQPIAVAAGPGPN
jgi:DNA-binding beta-propeller fold protein YncE